MLLTSALAWAGDGAAVAAADQTVEPEAYWDYGLGFGAVRFEHYPASNEFRTVGLPAPTFSYRGKILRADEKDGAHLYLYKGSSVTLELSGQGNAALSSSDNVARKGMDNLPWVIALGPQLVIRPMDDVQLSVSAFQAISTDFVMTRFAGYLYEAKAVHSSTSAMSAWGPHKESGTTTGKVSFSVRAGSKEFLALYFEVPPAAATVDRPAYEARDGLLGTTLSYFQSMRSGRFSLYTGASLNSYSLSTNRQSPLHKSDNNLVAVIGFNYILGESSKPAVPEAETSSVIETVHRKRPLQKNF